MAERVPDLFYRDIEDLNLTGSRVRGANFNEAHITGAWMPNTRIDGEFDGLILNGIEIAPLLDAELKRRHPILASNTSTSADGIRANIETVYAVWDALESRAEALGDAAMHERVNDEWSFIETMRHLIYATDCWYRRGVLDQSDTFHAIGLTHSEAHGKVPGIDLDANPTYAEVIAARRENQADVRAYVSKLTDADLLVTNTPTGDGHPSGSVPVGEPFWVIVNEEFWHAQYAARDLDVLSAR